MEIWPCLAGRSRPAGGGGGQLYHPYLAVTRPDPVLSEDYYQQGININQKRLPGQDASLAPAMQARNHAATGVVPELRLAAKP